MALMSALDPKAKGRLDWLTAIRFRDQSDPWWDGRQVAIRPDVPGQSFDPRNIVLVRSDSERLEAQVGIDRFVDETKGKSSGDLWPQWLWDADDPAVVWDDQTG
jgi:hypothetical protein